MPHIHIHLHRADDAGTSEGARKAAQTRHLHMTATPENSGRAAFRTKASNFGEIEKHLSALHEHIRRNNLPIHNVSIENKETGEVHSAKVTPRGIIKHYSEEPPRAFHQMKPGALKNQLLGRTGGGR